MLIQYLLRIIPFVAAYFALFILIFPGSLVRLLFGTRWATFSQYPLIVASIVFVFVLVTNLISNISNSLGLVKDRLKISVYAVLLNIVTSGFLIYYFGVTGAVLSIGLVHLFMLLLIVQSIKKIVFLAFPWVYYLKLLLVLPVIYFFFMKIICLEGSSGTGKTTQYHLLNEHYNRSNLNHLAVVEKEYEPFKSSVREWHETKGPNIPFTEEDVKSFARARAETFANNFSDLEILEKHFLPQLLQH